ncbi:MAG: hypothetical protein HFH60_11055 [Lachnospiraceae bacterium]|nr:hypothetical protein [Lachnospiraceae bacterium]
MKRKILALFLSVGIVITGLPANALAAGVSQEVNEAVQEDYADLSHTVIQEGGFLPETEERASASSVESDKKEQVQDALKAAWDSFSSTCDLTAYQIQVEDFRGIYAETLNKNPKYFYVSGQCSYSYNSNGVLRVNIQYTKNASEAKSMRETYDREVVRAVSGAQPSWSDMEKALYINDYLARNCEYDTSYVKYTAYDALVGRAAVCQGYALAFLDLAQELGLSCEMVTSESLNHAWNLVKLGGSYYNVDVTWNDPVYDRLGRACHAYFMKSTAFFKTGAGVETHLKVDDWVVSGGIQDTAASNTKYDNYFWNKADVGFDYIDGNWYGFNGNDSICKYSCDGTDFVLSESVKPITDTWTVIGSSGGYWQGKFVGVGSFNGKYYYSGRDSIYELNVATKQSVPVFTLSDAQKQSGYIYGMNISSSGELQYILAESPNASGEVLTAVRLEQPHVHTEEVRNALEATCQREGYTGDVYCSGCGALIRKGTVVEKKAHTLVTDEAIPATCTEEGKTQGSHCSVCNEVIEEQEIISPLGHDWDSEYTIDKPATAEEDGEKSIHCRRCQERKDIQSIPKEEPGHVHKIVISPEIPATCTEEGKTQGSYCSECGEVIEAQDIIPAKGHQVVIDEAVPGACTEEGKTEGSHCEECGEILQEQEIIPAGHDWNEEYTIDRPATAEEDGEKSIHCNKCDERKDVQVIPKVGLDHEHTSVEYPEISATCTTAGRTKGSRCKECGETLHGLEKIPASGHREAIDEAVSATCTKEGKTQGSHCSVCNEVIDKQEIIPPMGHEWDSEYTVDREPTTERDGEKSIHCIRCQERLKVQSIPKLEKKEVELSSCKITLATGRYIYNGNAKKPAVTVKNGDEILTLSKDYQVKYSNNIHAGMASVTIMGKGIYTGSVTKNFQIGKADNQIRVTAKYNKVSKTSAQTFRLDARASGGSISYQSQNRDVKVAKDGKVTIAKNFAGKAVIKVTAGSGDYSTVTKNITITVNPAGVNLTRVKNVSGKKLALKWKKNSKASGYQIQYSTSKKFTGAKSKLVPGGSKTAKTLTKLNKKKTYYVRIRTYKTVAKVKYYSSWSSAKKCIIKK